MVTRTNFNAFNTEIPFFKSIFETFIKTYPNYINLSKCDDVDITPDLEELVNRITEIHYGIINKLSKFIDETFPVPSHEKVVDEIKMYINSIASAGTEYSGNDELYSNMILNLFSKDMKGAANLVYSVDVTLKAMTEMITRAALANWNMESSNDLIDFIQPDLCYSIIAKYSSSYTDPVITDMARRASEMTIDDLKQDNFHLRDDIIDNIATMYIDRCFGDMRSITNTALTRVDILLKDIRNYIHLYSDKPVFNERKVYKVIQDISMIICIDMTLIYCLGDSYRNNGKTIYSWFNAAENCINSKSN